MTIYLDFDGTMVEHIYPDLDRVVPHSIRLGRVVPHSIRVVDRLVKAGHEIVLNTYRANLNKDFPGVLEQAKHWLANTWRITWRITRREEKFVDSIPLTHVNPDKVGPYAFSNNGELQVYDGAIFLDDQALGTPLIPAVMSNGQMVDWLAVEKILEDNSLLPKTVTDGL